jgi:hypothetical protein
MTSSFKLCTSGERRCEPETAREAWHCQVHHSKIRTEQIADALKISPTALSDAVNPHADGSLLAARHHEHVLTLTPDNMAVMHYYAYTRGEIITKLPVVGESANADVARVVREFGELLTEQAKADGDQKISADEDAKVEREGYQAIAAIVSLVNANKARRAKVSIGS